MEALLGAGPVQLKAKQNFRLYSSAGNRLFDIHKDKDKTKLKIPEKASVLRGQIYKYSSGI